MDRLFLTMDLFPDPGHKMADLRRAVAPVWCLDGSPELGGDGRWIIAPTAFYRKKVVGDPSHTVQTRREAREEKNVPASTRQASSSLIEERSALVRGPKAPFSLLDRARPVFSFRRGEKRKWGVQP